MAKQVISGASIRKMFEQNSSENLSEDKLRALSELEDYRKRIVAETEARLEAVTLLKEKLPKAIEEKNYSKFDIVNIIYNFCRMNEEYLMREEDIQRLLDNY